MKRPSPRRLRRFAGPKQSALPFLVMSVLAIVLIAGVFGMLQREQPPAPAPSPTPEPVVQQPTPVVTATPEHDDTIVVEEDGEVHEFVIDDAVKIQPTDYPIPDDAIFVAPDGDNSDGGTEDAPWQTLAYAIDAAPDGATIVLRAGTYREGDLVIEGKALTLQPYLNEEVWIKGSVVVDGWEQERDLWRVDGWNYRFDHEVRPQAIDPRYPLAGYADMVFIDGEPLRQVGSKSEVTEGAFFVSYDNSQLYIADDPHDKEVEATAYAQALVINDTPGTVVRGLGFMHYATRIQNGAVRGNAANLTFENNTFAWNAAAGLSVIGPDSVVRGNLSAYNGQLGIHGTRADRLLLEANVIVHNNQERFNILWEAGGLKITGSRRMIWRENVVAHNQGIGMWCDISCFNTTIVRNVVRDNSDKGINYEISANAIIASNVAVNNGYGININESNNVSIYNNTLVRNGTGIRVHEGTRTNDNPQTQAQIPWDVSGIVIENNLFVDGQQNSKEQVLVIDFRNNQARKSADQMLSSLNYNAYYRADPTLPPALVRLSTTIGEVEIDDLETLRTTAGYEQQGVSLDASAEPLFVDEAQGDFRLRADTPVRGVGAPLPPAVARALGVTQGAPSDMGALAAPQLEDS